MNLSFDIKNSFQTFFNDLILTVEFKSDSKFSSNFSVCVRKTWHTFLAENSKTRQSFLRNFNYNKLVINKQL